MSTPCVLFYLGVGRLHKSEAGEFIEGQHSIVACAVHPSVAASEHEYRTHVGQIMDKGATKLKPDKRIRLTADDNNYDLHVLAEPLGDTLLVYFAVTDTEFGKDFNVQQLLDDFKFHFRDLFERGDIESAKPKGSCHRGSQDFLTTLLSKYGTSKLRGVQAQVADVTVSMKENVDKALQNVEALGDLEDKSEQFEQQAKKFQKKAGAVKKMMRCRNWKTTALAVGICFIVVVIIVSLIVVLTSDGSTEVPTSAPTPTAVAPTSAPPTPAATAGRR